MGSTALFYKTEFELRDLRGRDLPLNIATNLYAKAAAATLSRLMVILRGKIIGWLILRGGGGRCSKWGLVNQILPGGWQFRFILAGGAGIHDFRLDNTAAIRSSRLDQ